MTEPMRISSFSSTVSVRTAPSFLFLFFFFSFLRMGGGVFDDMKKPTRPAS